MNKRYLLISILVIIALVATACSGGGNSNSGNGQGNNQGNGANADQDKPAESVYLDFFHDKAGWVENLDKVGELIAENTGVGFKSVPTAGTTEYQTVVRQTLQGNNPPALFSWWSGFRMEDIVKSGLVADLTEEWQRYYIPVEGINPDLANAFSFEGKIYGAPLSGSYWNVFYNKKVFDEYGLEEPKTWDEFIQVAETLKQNGVTPLGLSFQGWQNFIWFAELLAKYDPDLYADVMVGKAAYTDPGVVEVMEIYKDMLDKGYFSQPGKIDGDLLQDFIQGDIAMHLVGQWFNNNLMQAEMVPGEDYGAFILPPIRDGVSPSVIFETGPILVAEHSKQKEDALKALREFMKEDAQQLWIESQGFAPIRPGVQATNAVTNKVFKDIEEGGHRLLQRYWEATPPQISEFAVEELGRFILNPDQYKTVLETIENHAKQYWAQ